MVGFDSQMKIQQMSEDPDGWFECSGPLGTTKVKGREAVAEWLGRQWAGPWVEGRTPLEDGLPSIVVSFTPYCEEVRGCGEVKQWDEPRRLVECELMRGHLGPHMKLVPAQEATVAMRYCWST